MDLVDKKTYRMKAASDYNEAMFMEHESSISHRPQCKCTRFPKYLKKNCNNECFKKNAYSCPLAHKWCHIGQAPSNRAEIYAQLQFVNIESDTYRKYAEQIEIDLTRTFPDIEYFTTGAGVDSLRRVLRSFVKYHYQLGYVQGMNYIVCALLWHASEVDAFWLLVIIMDEYKLRENYLFKFPGLTKHCELSELLISLYLPKLYTHFTKFDIYVQTFASDWYLTLFTSLIPIQSSFKLFSYFFKYGWVFIYKLLLTILERLEKKILELEDGIFILGIIKPLELVNNESNGFLMSLQKKRETLTWDKLMVSAKKKSLEMRHVNNFLQNYNMEIFNE
jgi:hypothetical protein